MVSREGSPYTICGDATPRNETIDLISQDMKLMVKKIQDLRHLGIENSGLPLPKIVVVGDQSTGKSSLIEGISEIKVPRSSGCCTRCPLEINLSESDNPWICRVLLMKRYLYVPKGRPTSKNPLGPWIEQELEEILFDTLTDKSMLEKVLKWAQIATLNPARSPKDFGPDNDNDTYTFTQVKFSPNVVRLDISAPGFPNLSFYDLPGVINVAEIEEEKYLVTLVENLVKEYIKADNTIVLLTMPMTDDATNSSAARIVREIRGARDRTLGVLTKPDRIESGYDQWQELLDGKKFLLGHGYYVVKNNSDPIVTHMKAREEEHMFFAHSPWTTTFAEYSERFGTRKLQAALSNLLLKQIQSSLPRIIEQIDQRAKLVDDELCTLPDPPSANIPYILCQKLNILICNVQAHMDGGVSRHLFLKRWGQLAVEFRSYLEKSRPSLKIGDNIEVRIPPRVFSAVDEDDECEIMEHKSPLKRKPVNGDGGESKRPRTGSPSIPSPMESAPARPAMEYFHAFPVPAKIFTPEDIRNINIDTYASGVPGLGNPQAVEEINRLSVKHWLDPMRTFLSATYNMMVEVLIEEVDIVFGQYQQTVLYVALKAIMMEFLDSIKVEHYRQATEIYDIECSKPFTLAEANFSKAQKETLDVFCSKRRSLRTRAYAQKMGELTGKPYNEKSISPMDLGSDSFQKEMEIMASSRAYYDIASSRFLDVTCQCIHTKLFLRCRNELRAVIEEKLGILGPNASERCMELMIEDESRQRRRIELRREKEKLEKAQAGLRGAGENSNTSDLFV
ncbi:hypothetical protein LOZ67_000843 [Ophidiomyces ophidiicola]|nr:hypothetical protein LOZ67_000843 [Ophidiomyces ophidiicola]